MNATVLYLSHGAPPLLKERRRIVEVWKSLRREFRRQEVDAVVVASPHWASPQGFLVQVSPMPRCIQDYYDFPKEYYSYRYEASNDLELAELLVEQGSRRGLHVRSTEEWGLDHGAWLPLYVMFPEAQTPVVPVSWSPIETAEAHREWGQAIAEAARTSGRRVLFVATGSTIHRLDLVRFGYHGDDFFPPAKAFDEVLLQLLREGRLDDVLMLEETHPDLFRAAAPEAGLRTLYMALGAAGRDARAEVLSYEPWYYSVSLVALRFRSDDDGTVT
jgi:aromatic ring-opening dioxygenase catalytic subunit (LigB family)